MATQTTTALVDDIDGSTDDVLTCAFGLGDSHFEIDLGAAHRSELEDVLAKFVEAARPVKVPREQVAGRTGKPQRKVSSYDASAVREWARSNGFTVSGRGRVPQSVVDAYQAAH